MLGLDPGETGTAKFTVTAEQFVYFGRDNKARVDAGEIVLQVGPDALTGVRTTLTVTA